MEYSYFAALQLVIVTLLEASPCPRIHAPKYGSFGKCKSDLQAGDHCHFKCGRGFELIGHKVLRCMVNQNGEPFWEANVPTCKPYRCIELTEPQHGWIEDCVPGTLYEGRCVFACHDGMYLKGKREVFCESDGESTLWSDAVPTCVPAICPTLQPPVNGAFDGCKSKTKIDGYCSFKCNKGYEIVGTRVLTCGWDRNGKIKWMSSVPKCKWSVPKTKSKAYILIPSTIIFVCLLLLTLD